VEVAFISTIIIIIIIDLPAANYSPVNLVLCFLEDEPMMITFFHLLFMKQIFFHLLASLLNCYYSNHSRKFLTTNDASSLVYFSIFISLLFAIDSVVSAMSERRPTAECSLIYYIL